MTEHTALPWKLVKEQLPRLDGYFYDRIEAMGSGKLIAESVAYETGAIRNLEFAVRACNSYYKLLEALEYTTANLVGCLPLLPDNVAQSVLVQVRAAREAIREAKGEQS